MKSFSGSAENTLSGRTPARTSGMAEGKVLSRRASGKVRAGEESVEKVPSSGIIRLSKYETVVIPENKFIHYALDPERGPDKAGVFKETVEYGQSNYKDLIANIQEHLPNCTAAKKG